MALDSCVVSSIQAFRNPFTLFDFYWTILFAEVTDSNIEHKAIPKNIS